MITHITIGAADKAQSVGFYEAVLRPLGYTRILDNARWTGFGRGEGHPPILVGSPFEGEASAGNGVMLGFRAPTRAKVDELYAAGLKAGGVDAGPPGPRPQGPPNNYAAYLRDPVGNKIAISCAG
jgi:catechol 2,3-dioxygenase-like lactoylglutathione lyase family enzyme